MHRTLLAMTSLRKQATVANDASNCSSRRCCVADKLCCSDLALPLHHTRWCIKTSQTFVLNKLKVNKKFVKKKINSITADNF